MTIGERIKIFRENSDMTQEVLAAKIGTTKQTIYKYENNVITNIPSDKIERLADIFGISPIVLMGWDNDFAVIEQELYKANARNILNNPSSSIKEKCLAKIQEYLCLFARSVKLTKSQGQEFHPDFNTYISMMLNQERQKRNMDIEVYNELKKEYGTCPGIEEGSSYWYSKRNVVVDNDNDNNDDDDENEIDLKLDLNKSEEEMIEKYRCLDNSGKETVTSVLDIQYNRCMSNTTDERCTVSDNVVAYKTPILNAAHERTDIEVTDEMRQHDEDIMDDENF